MFYLIFGILIGAAYFITPIVFKEKPIKKQSFKKKR